MPTYVPRNRAASKTAMLSVNTACDIERMASNFSWVRQILEGLRKTAAEGRFAHDCGISLVELFALALRNTKIDPRRAVATFVNSGGTEVPAKVTRFCEAGVLALCNHPGCQNPVTSGRFKKQVGEITSYYCSISCFERQDEHRQKLCGSIRS